MTSHDPMPEKRHFPSSAWLSAVRSMKLENTASAFIDEWDSFPNLDRLFDYPDFTKRFSWTAWVAESETGQQIQQAQARLRQCAPSVYARLSEIIEEAKTSRRDADVLRKRYMVQNPEAAQAEKAARLKEMFTNPDGSMDEYFTGGPEQQAAPAAPAVTPTDPMEGFDPDATFDEDPLEGLV